MNWQAFSQTLQTQFDLDLHIETASPVGGGDIHQAFHLKTSQGSFFLKMNHAAAAPMFQTEMNSLKTLAETLVINIPNPIATGIFEKRAWLLMDYLEIIHRGDDTLRGKDLALLHHQVEPQKRFGWYENNYIGNTPQSNDWSSDWVEFYAQQRLMPQLTLAHENGGADQLIELGHRLIEVLPKFFEHYQPEPSLLHGDLWGGNSGFLSTGEAVFFDPASYYGDRETDLAMTELFGGFSSEFYQGYEEVFPLDPGYAQRKPLYNLYHILNHFNLFGGGYQTQALNLIQHLLHA